MTFDSGSASPKLRFVATALAFGCLYFVVAALTDALVGDPGVAVLWPASGVYLGVALAAPRRLWAALACGAAVGSLAAYVNAGSSLELAVGFAVPSSAEGLLGAVLVERIAGRRFALGGLRDTFALVAGAVVATMLVGLSAGAVAAQTFNTSFGESWLRWWSADALGVLAFAPLVVALRRTGRRRPSRGQLGFAACVALGVAVASGLEPSAVTTLIGGALVFPVLLWAGWRWGSRAAALGAAGLAFAATHLASDGGDLIASAGTTVYVLQAFLAVLLLGSLLFAAAVGDARGGLAEAARSRLRLRLVTDFAPGAYLAVDATGRICGWSAGAERMFGGDAEYALGRTLDETIAPGAGPATATTRELVLLARRVDGHQFPVELAMRPGSDADEGICHVFARDLSEHERMVEELRRADAELEQRRLSGDQQIEKLREELRERRNELGETRRELATAEQDLRRADRQLESTTSELARVRDGKSALENEAQTLRAKQARTAEELAEAASARRDAESARERAERALAESSSGTERVARELAEAVAGRQHAERALAEAESGRERAERELAEAASGGERFERELAEAVSGRQRAERELDQIAGRLRLLEDAAARLESADAERRLLSEHSTELVSRYDERGICLYASPASRRLLGYEPDELVGRPGADLLHPDDRARLLRARAAGSETSFEARLRHREGDYIWVEVTLHPVLGPDSDRPIELTTTVRELSRQVDVEEARRAADTRFRWVFSTMPTAGAMLTGDGRVERANLALCRLTGYSRDQLEGTALATIVDDDEDAAALREALHRVASGGAATARLSQGLVHASGRGVRVELGITALPTGELVAHLHAASDRNGAREDLPHLTPDRALR
ncbi:MAG TPA: PAS domain S-box protein [Thermoleophilaceae bacterium]